MEEKKIRVLVVKPGLDGHDRGAKLMTHIFRDAGMEVVYTGYGQSPDQIASAAIQEDVDVIGNSINGSLTLLTSSHINLDSAGVFSMFLEGYRKRASVRGDQNRRWKRLCRLQIQVGNSWMFFLCTDINYFIFDTTVHQRNICNFRKTGDIFGDGVF